MFSCVESLGNIRNTEKLSYDKQHQYEIMVTAFDCGQKHATEDVLVQVNVKPVCKPGWQGKVYSLSILIFCLNLFSLVFSLCLAVRKVECLLHWCGKLLLFLMPHSKPANEVDDIPHLFPFATFLL